MRLWKSWSWTQKPSYVWSRFQLWFFLCGVGMLSIFLCVVFSRSSSFLSNRLSLLKRVCVCVLCRTPDMSAVYFHLSPMTAGIAPVPVRNHWWRCNSHWMNPLNHLMQKKSFYFFFKCGCLIIPEAKITVEWIKKEKVHTCRRLFFFKQFSIISDPVEISLLVSSRKCLQLTACLPQSHSIHSSAVSFSQW